MTMWRVESVTPSTEFAPGGTAVEGNRVNFVTESGTAGYVFVPRAQMANTDAVSTLITEAASQLESVRFLTG